MNGEGWENTAGSAPDFRSPAGETEEASSRFRGVTLERLELLAAAGALLACSTDYAAILPAVARLLVPRLADWCAFDVFQASTSGAPVLKRVATASEGWAPASLAGLAEVYSPEAHAQRETVRAASTGDAEFIPEVGAWTTPAEVRLPDRAARLRSVGVQSFLATPLIARGRILGALSLLTGPSGRPLRPEDLAFATDLALHAARAIDYTALIDRAPDPSQPRASGAMAAGGLLGPGPELERERRVQRRFQAELEQAHAQALRLKAEFVGNISHEVRTPMHAILGMTELLLHTPLSGQQREFTETIASASQSLLELINDVLDLSELDAGSVRAACVPYPFRSLVQECADRFRPLAAAKGLGLTVDMAEDVPAVICGDAERVGQVLQALLDNAVKFTAAGSVRVAVELDHAPGAEARLRLLVEDTGIGLNEAAVETLFQRFVQGDGSPTRRHGGAGLGLSLCRQRVELMGGDIGGESRASGGARFWFTVPLGQPVPSGPGGALPGCDVFAAGATAERTRDSAPRVLLAEDNPVNQRVALLQLRTLGFHVHPVATGREALEAVATSAYDLVLMDCQMPDLDGYEATRAIRRREAGGGGRLPIIAMTAHAMLGDRERCLEAGMDDYLSKPVQMSELGCLLGRWIPHEEPPAARPQSPAPAGAVAHPISLEVLRGAFGDNEEVLRELLLLFMKCTRPLVRQLRMTVDGRCAAERAQATHDLVGSCETMGALAMGGWARRVEAAATAADWSTATAACEALAASFREAEAFVSAYCGRGGRSLGDC